LPSSSQREDGHTKEERTIPIPIDKFKDLPPAAERGPAVANEQLLTKLSSDAMPTKEVAGFLGVQTGSAYSRLTKLEAKGVVERRMYEGVQYWGAVADWKEILAESDEEESDEDE